MLVDVNWCVVSELYACVLCWWYSTYRCVPCCLDVFECSVGAHAGVLSAFGGGVDVGMCKCCLLGVSCIHVCCVCVLKIVYMCVVCGVLLRLDAVCTRACRMST